MSKKDAKTSTGELPQRLFKIAMSYIDSMTDEERKELLIRNYVPNETYEQWQLKIKESEIQYLKQDVELEKESSQRLKNLYLELASKSPYDLACKIVRVNPSKYNDLLVPLYEYIAERFTYKKKDGSINRSQVARHIRKIAGNTKKSERTVQAALSRYINSKQKR